MVEIEVKCRCGTEFKTTIDPWDDNPWNYMCRNCFLKDDWKYHLRLLRLEKIKCVRCGWRITYKDQKDSNESEITFKCSCCGYRFTLWHGEPFE